MKKKSSISKSVGRPAGTGKGKRIPGTNKIVKGTSHGEDPKLVVHRDQVPDPELIMPEPTDEISKHQYPPHKKNFIFRKFWAQFIDSVCRRDNFIVGHLNFLGVLCDLFTEYEELQTFIRTNGRTYQSYGRSGMQWKLYPEVAHLKSVQHQINVYMKQLGLTLRRDETGLSDGEASEWE